MSDVNQRLFNYMKEEHGVTLLESDINEIKLICAEEGKSEQLKCQCTKIEKYYDPIGDVERCQKCEKAL